MNEDSDAAPARADETDPQQSSEPSGSTEIERALGQLAPPGASVSTLAVRADDSAVVAALNPDRAVAPASNTKLFTAALALDHLGPDDRFETTFSPRGEIEDRALDGDLVLLGTGAPDLAPTDLSALADGVADRVARVEGDLILDASRFEGPQLGPGRVWTDERHAYGARSSALALSGNIVAVTVEGADGDVSVSVDPRTDVIEVDVDVTLDPEVPGDAEDGDALDIYRDSERERVRAEGRIPPGTSKTVEVPVGSPVCHCGLAAREALAAAGVDVRGVVRIANRPPETGSDLAAVESAPVRDLVRTMNRNSDNFVADTLAREIAMTATGEGSWEAWSETVADQLATFGLETVRLRDGSGLSRYNLVPARGIVALLEWTTERPWADAFFGSLPSPGEGTLADRLDGVPVVAKTGTLSGVRALSGRIGDGDDAILFAILVDGLTVDEGTVRDRQDDVVRALATSRG